MVVSEGGAIGEVKVFLGRGLYIYDDADESWDIVPLEDTVCIIVNISRMMRMKLQESS